MATQINGPDITVIAAEAITAFVLVRQDVTTGRFSETSGLAGEDINTLGVSQEAAAAAGDPFKVRMLNCVATAKAKAVSTNITIGQTLYTADNGLLSNANTSGTPVGLAKNVSDTLGDMVEFYPRPGRDDADIT